jgi:hypothetical protein
MVISIRCICRHIKLFTPPLLRSTFGTNEWDIRDAISLLPLCDPFPSAVQSQPSTLATPVSLGSMCGSHLLLLHQLVISHFS